MEGTKKKKIIKGFLLSIAILVIAVFLFFGIYTGISFIKTKDINLKSEAQIKNDKIAFDADLTYLLDYNIFGKTVRLGYNKGTSIKVVLSSEINESIKHLIKKVYENKINPIMLQINKNYYFEVVNENDFIKKNTDKVIIHFKKMQDSTAWASNAKAEFGFLHAGINPIYTNLKIMINELGEINDATIEDSTYEYSIIHEILHTFGLDDVYNIENHSTLLKNDNYTNTFPQLKTNDIKALAALYFDDYTNLENLKTWIADYNDKYYLEFGKLFSEIKELENFEKIPTGVTDDGMVYYQKLDPTELIKISELESINLIGHSNNYSYKFEIKNGAFHYNLINSKQDIIEDKQGKYYLVDGKLFLGIINIRDNSTPYRIELSIVNTEEGYKMIVITDWFDDSELRVNLSVMS